MQFDSNLRGSNLWSKSHWYQSNTVSNSRYYGHAAYSLPTPQFNCFFKSDFIVSVIKDTEHYHFFYRIKIYISGKSNDSTELETSCVAVEPQRIQVVNCRCFESPAVSPVSMAASLVRVTPLKGLITPPPPYTPPPHPLRRPASLGCVSRKLPETLRARKAQKSFGGFEKRAPGPHKAIN